MKKKRNIAGKRIAALLIIVLVFAFVSILHTLGFFQILENISYDLRVRFSSSQLQKSDNIIVILVNQASIDWSQQERGWGWPWPREAYAEIIEYMNLAGASSVTFDIIFSDPSMHGTEDDVIFIQSSQDYGRVVQGIFFSSQTGNIRTWPSELNVPLFETMNFGSFLEEFGKGGDGFDLIGAQFPIQGLRDTAGALGSLTGISDSDDIFRRVRLFTLFDGQAVPGLAAASLIVARGADHVNEISYDSGKRIINWGDFVIPVDRNGKSLLRFRGDLDRYIPFSAANVLQSYDAYKRGEEPLYYPEDFTDCHVFVGYYAPGLYDIFSTPVSTVYPGMGIHITLLDNILLGDLARESRQWINLILLFAVVCLIVILCLFSRQVFLSIAGTILTVSGVVALCFAAYHWGCLWLPMVMPLVGIALAFISTTFYNYVTEGSQRRFIKSAFSQYLSSVVIDQIIADPSQLKLGGEKREMTAIFTDIRAFSMISEGLNDPEKLVEIINQYLTRMSDIILENQGTIDKYEGDAIIAFFGAPVHLDNHASLACSSALMMKKAEPEINREIIAQGLISNTILDTMVKNKILQSIDDPCPLFTRIGINTGDMVVGNMGTSKKMDYTIMGGAVNIAARLEGANKHFSTNGILLSEYTKEQIGDEFVLRPLSLTRMVGINTPLRLYELLEFRKDASSALLEMINKWEHGLNLYEKMDFSKAKDIFEAIFKDNGTDFVSKMYYNKCSKYLKSAPSRESWDEGVENLMEK